MTQVANTLTASKLAALGFVLPMLDGTHAIIPRLKDAAKATELLTRIRQKHLTALSYRFGKVRPASQFNSNASLDDPSNAYPDIALNREAVFSLSFEDGELAIEMKMRGRNHAGGSWADEETPGWHVDEILFKPMRRHMPLFAGIPQILNEGGWPCHLKFGWTFAGPIIIDSVEDPALGNREIERVGDVKETRPFYVSDVDAARESCQHIVLDLLERQTLAMGADILLGGSILNQARTREAPGKPSLVITMTGVAYKFK